MKNLLSSRKIQIYFFIFVVAFVFISGLTVGADEVCASHICAEAGEDGFVYTFSFYEPDNNEEFDISESIGVHIHLHLDHCFNAPQANYDAFYDNQFVESGTFPNTKSLDSDSYFTIPNNIVRRQGLGTKQIRVEIETNDSCGVQNHTISRNVIITGQIEPDSYTLRVNKAGSGSGIITAQGINCGNDCRESYRDGVRVDLNASPDSDSTFSGFGGDCNSNGVVVMNSDKNCSATFEDKPDPGYIRVKATLNDEEWTGGLQYTLHGPQASLSGNSVETTHSDVETGLWTINYSSGGPVDSTLVSGDGATKRVREGYMTTFILSFERESVETESDLIVSNVFARNIDSNQQKITFGSGDQVRFIAEVQNIGSGSTIEGFITRFTRNRIFVSDEGSGRLNSGGSTILNSDVWTARPGTWNIRACADYGNRIREVFENNNCKSSSIIVEGNAGGGSGNFQCNDGVDNEDPEDELIDYPSDPGCDSLTDDDETNAPNLTQCNDGKDNDGDGWIDNQDPNCSEVDIDIDDLQKIFLEAGQATGTQCGDGIDNDGDGLIDGNDPDCAGPDDNSEAKVDFQEF